VYIEAEYICCYLL